MINEASKSEIDRRQSDIGLLFPKYYERVRRVGDAGGVRVERILPDILSFKVHSQDKPIWYVAIVKVRDLDKQIDKFVRDKEARSKTGELNFSVLAGKILSEGDLQLFCSCPADLYWGFHYIRSRDDLDAKYTEKENRRPRRNNVLLRGAYCKHLGLLSKVLLFYISSYASVLKRVLGDEINKKYEEVKNE